MINSHPPKNHLKNTGRRTLLGLTREETFEFERLDASLPYDGEFVWPDEKLPLLPIEERWLELWKKHQAAVARKQSRLTHGLQDR